MMNSETDQIKIYRNSILILVIFICICLECRYETETLWFTYSTLPFSFSLTVGSHMCAL